MRPALAQAADVAAATLNPAYLLAMPFNTPADTSGLPDSGDPEGGPKNKGWAAALQQIVRILAGYSGLRFVPFYVLKKHGENEQNTPRRWRTVLGLEEIQYLPEDIDSDDQQTALGRAAHEAWHVVFSRPELIFDAPKELLESMAFQALWWSVEDARVNVQGLKRHPGARDWVDAAYAKDYEPKDEQDLADQRRRWAQEIPLHLQFNYALIYEWWSGRRDPRISDEKVHAALDAAAKAIRRAYSTADARRSFDIVAHEIWPIYKELIDEAYEREQQKKNKKDKQKGQGQGEGESDDQDQQDQDQDQDQDSDSQSQSSSSQSKPGKPKPGKPSSGQQKQKKKQPVSDDVKKEMEKKEREQRDKHASKMVEKPEKMSEAEREKAKKEMEKLREKMGQKDKSDDDQQAQDSDSDSESDSQSQKPPSEDHKKKQRERLNKPDLRPEVDKDNDASYREYYNRVRHLVPVMKQQFLQVLKRRVRRRTIHDRKSGDLDEEALHELPAGKKDPFAETVVANKSLYRISLLIDTSGSMSGEKKERAIEGAVMLMETLEKLPGVSYEIVAFDSTPRVLKAYNEKVTPAMKAAVVKAILNGSGSTESHVAVEQAIERIRMGRGDKLMIMVNDGDPDNNFNRDQYRAMIERAKDVDIHGIGLGPEAQLVLDLFPPGRGWWLKDVAEFAKNLRNIIKKKLLG